MATELNATAVDQTDGTTYELTGKSVKEIAVQLKELADNGAEVSRVVVYDEPGFVRGWAHPDGSWTAQ